MSEFYVFTGRDYKGAGNWEDSVLETGMSYPYQDFEPYEGEVTDKKKVFIQPSYMRGSDYSGGLATLSNHNVFLKEFEKVEGVYDLHGAYGGYGIAIRADVAEDNEKIKDVLDGLENYGLIYEEAYSELENKWQQEAMKHVVDDLCGKIDLIDLIPDYEAFLENMEAIEQLAWDGVNELNLGWSIENNSAYLDYEEVMPYVEDRLLIDHCKDLPLLISREWSCEQTKKLFEQKLKGTTHE